MDIEPEIEYQLIAKVNGEEVYRQTAPLIETIEQSLKQAKDDATFKYNQLLCTEYNGDHEYRSGVCVYCDEPEELPVWLEED